MTAKAENRASPATETLGHGPRPDFALVGVIAKCENFKRNKNLAFVGGALFIKIAYKRVKEWLHVVSDLAIFCAFGHAVNPNA
jgi:hypothetical protein